MNKRPYSLSLISLMLVSLVLNGCSSSPRHIHYYALKAASSAPSVSSNVEGGIGIGPVQLPESHVSDGILTLEEGQRVNISADHIWAGDLKLGISRSLAQTLSQQLNKTDIIAYPWDSRLKPERQVFINIEQLSGPLGGELRFIVQWSVFDNKQKTILSHQRQNYTLAARKRNYSEYVADINDLILMFAVDLARSFAP